MKPVEAQIRELLDLLYSVVETNGELHRGGVLQAIRTLEAALDELVAA